MTSRNIIFIINTKLTRNDVIKFGCEFYKKKNHKVFYFNLIPITRNNYYRNYNSEKLADLDNHKLISNLDDFDNDISNYLNPIIFVILPVKNIHTQKIFEILNKKKLNYYSINSGLLPIPPLHKSELLYHAIFNPFIALKKLIKKNQNIKMTNFKPKIIFTNNDNKKNKVIKTYKIPTYDYDQIIKWENENKQNNFDEKNYFVFLETPYSHPDGLFAEGRFPPEKPCNFDNWYSPLNKFLNNFCKLKKTKIITIPHPRSTDKALKAISVGHTSYQNKIKLIFSSNGVFTFASSALSIAVYFNKPIIFLNQKNFTFHNKRNIRYLSNFFNTKPLDMNEKLTLEKINSRLLINKKSYEKFKYEYLGFPSNQTSYEKISKLIENNII